MCERWHITPPTWFARQADGTLIGLAARWGLITSWTAKGERETLPREASQPKQELPPVPPRPESDNYGDQLKASHDYYVANRELILKYIQTVGEKETWRLWNIKSRAAQINILNGWKREKPNSTESETHAKIPTTPRASTPLIPLNQNEYSPFNYLSIQWIFTILTSLTLPRSRMMISGKQSVTCCDTAPLREERRAKVAGFSDYQLGRAIVDGHNLHELDSDHFYALIQAAMRLADTDNLKALKKHWPKEWQDLQARYSAPGGLLPDERSKVD